jgi:gamma-glutamylcyclotransferase
MRIILEKNSGGAEGKGLGRWDFIKQVAVSHSQDSRIVVFAYGSNMLTARIQERAPSARAVTIGQLVGFELCWNKRSKDGSGKCSLTETGLPKDGVWGVVFDMSAEDKANLDRAEGLGRGYGERVVKIATPSGSCSAMTYYATSISPGLRPYDWYRDLVVAGASAHRLPEEYIRALEAVGSMSDADSKRAESNRRLLIDLTTDR